ncbi:MAG: hydroxypyruvate isomerase [Rhizobiales bacterium 24-66-13]|nr:MAG: hydroxypyruvate isomerase [Rhizobiales bacterium 12-66-7]OYY74640.1 MAG: hydroxypyruvate isomerase [Rhizobiales bacterium 35-66-30]OYZ67247.1 MAG: hydroxypyruvate isomerase [Rhizobiales bacterium 24-66-13]OZB03453.1 MAG: hydroxypyruvate isomerase [Rhizobiales bacterium 39-66-18]HQS10252.1 hydroxypyruvate isomerase [Xanthobacteraceae bacterium]
MPKLAANLTMLWNELDFTERFVKAASVGFKGVEYLFPYAYPAEQLAEKLKENGLTQALHNLPAGDWAKGERGIAVLPDRVGEFQDSVGKGIEYAKVLGTQTLNVLVGLTPKDVPAEKVHETLVSNLKFAAAELKKAGIPFVAEAINTRDIPGFYLTNTKQSLALFDEVGADDIFFQYDIYHMQIMEGDLVPTIRANLARIKHIQLADNPGRGEPGTGEINYPFVLKAIDEAGYTGWVGCEYKPKTTTDEGIGWIKDYQ